MWNIYVGPSGSVNISFGAEWKCEEFMWDWVNMWKFQVGPSKMWKSRWADQKCEKFRCDWVKTWTISVGTCESVKTSCGTGWKCEKLSMGWVKMWDWVKILNIQIGPS